MAVSKLWPVRERLGQVIKYATNPEKTDVRLFTEANYQALKDVLAYAKNETKTEHEYFCDGINCNVAIARSQFITVKEQYGKTEGIQAYHGYLSFPEKEVSPELCQKIGMEFAKRVWGKRFQVVVTTHLNTKHLHCHFVVNSVSFLDGKKLDDEEKAWFCFRHVVDDLCKEYNLSYIHEPYRTKANDYMTSLDKAGMPTRYNNTREAIDYAISHSKTMAEFKYALSKMGYSYNLSQSRKYWTVIPKGYNKPIRLKTLGEDYTNARIEERIKANRDRWAEIKPFQKQTIKPRQCRLQTRLNKIKKVGGLYGLYLHYCYKLGYLPKYKKQNIARLHYLLREDLMKLDKFSDEMRLLGKHHIDDFQQLFSYKESVQKEMDSLISSRELLRKKLKTKSGKRLMPEIKREISDITEKLKTLRKEVKICDSIAERSKVIKSNLEVIKADEEKVKRKEQRNYE